MANQDTIEVLRQQIEELNQSIESAQAALPYADRSYNDEKRRIQENVQELANLQDELKQLLSEAT